MSRLRAYTKRRGVITTIMFEDKMDRKAYNGRCGATRQPT